MGTKRSITAIAVDRVRKVARAGVKFGSLSPRYQAPKADQGVTPGVCRVCRCEDDAACEGGCYWIDEAHTLCSVCGLGFFHQVVAERSRQIAKFGHKRPTHGFVTLIAVLTEETGEVAKAVLEADKPGLVTELVQVAAVCMRMIEYLSDGGPGLLDHNATIPSFKKTRKARR